MPTLPPPQVSELTMKLVEVFEKEAEGNQSKFARMLDVDRSRSNNWLAGANEPNLKDRALQRRIAMLLGVSPQEVLRLAGYDVSDEPPAAASVGDSGAYLNRDGVLFTSVTDINARRRAQQPSKAQRIRLAS